MSAVTIADDSPCYNRSREARADAHRHGAPPAAARQPALLGADVAIFADVGGKHALPLVPVEIEQTARDLVKRVRGAVPVLVGSGVTPETVVELLRVERLVGAARRR